MPLAASHGSIQILQAFMGLISSHLTNSRKRPQSQFQRECGERYFRPDRQPNKLLITLVPGSLWPFEVANRMASK